LDVWEALFDKACEIALEFEIEVSRPRILGRQTERIIPVDNPSDHWRISLYLLVLDHLMEEISKRVVSNEARYLTSYLNLANLLNPTPELVDRLFNAYQTDLPRKEDSVDEVERWKIGWALVDDKPERLLETLHATNRDLCSSIR